MYKALKTAQMQIHESLLKLTDDIIQAVETGKPELVNSNKPVPELQNIQQLTEMLTYLHMKQETQFKEITSAIEDLNKNMAVLMAKMPQASMPQASMPQATAPQASMPKPETPSNTQTVSAESTIPSLQPTSAPSEILASVKHDESAIEVEEDAEVEVEEEVEEEPEVEVEEEVEEDAEVEVEEWTYKGMLFFKDTNEVVYSNEDGDVGEPVGKYDPIKKILKKI